MNIAYRPFNALRLDREPLFAPINHRGDEAPNGVFHAKDEVPPGTFHGGDEVPAGTFD